MLGYLGRFLQYKSHAFLIGIVNSIKNLNNCSLLFLVGDLELRKSIKIIIFGLINRVILIGVTNNMNELLQAMDVFLSLYEGYPVSVLEARVAGIPCIISDAITNDVSLTPLVK